MSFLPPDFNSFIAADCDRYAFICDYLAERGVKSSTVSIEGKKHVYVNFPSRAYNATFKIKTLLVHYDRAEGTPGANDNSAAVFQVLDFVERLAKSPAQHNMRVFFTDGEELGEADGVAAQGAFGIANRFKKLGITSDDVFVFDGCGRGNVIVISSAGKDSAGSAAFRARFAELSKQASQIAAAVSPGSWITLPVPYSDNAGFVASGIPAVAVTILPREEASALMLELHKDSGLEPRILSRKLRAGEESFLPLTWRLMHTTGDTAATLTPESFTLMASYLDSLARLRTLQ